MLNQNKIYFTTSWDDGSLGDLKVAEILRKEGVSGTFYIPKNFPYFGGKFSEYKIMDTNSIKYLSQIQEIGAHTLSHKRLDFLDSGELKKEIFGSKAFLEDIVGKEISMFAYPEGKYNHKIIEIVKEAGYKGARSTKKMLYRLPEDPYLIGVSIRLAPFPFRKLDKKNYYFGRLFDPIKEYSPMVLKLIPNLYSWQALARAFLKLSIEKGNYFHLYGHSWEIEKYGMWKDLKEFIRYLENFKEKVTFLTNSELINIILQKNENSFCER
jgi:peptidoglycan/xylan/chitin deacetylase (PgdA/CDA1 family)